MTVFVIASCMHTECIWQYLRNGCGAQCALSISSNTHHESLGEKSVYPYLATTAHHETPTLRQIQVGSQENFALKTLNTHTNIFMLKKNTFKQTTNFAQ